MSGGGASTTELARITWVWRHRSAVHTHDMALIQRLVLLCTTHPFVAGQSFTVCNLCTLWSPGSPTTVCYGLIWSQNCQSRHRCILQKIESIGNGRGIDQAAQIARSWLLELYRKKNTLQTTPSPSICDTHMQNPQYWICGKGFSIFWGRYRCPLCISVRLDSPRTLWNFFQKFTKHLYAAHTAVVHTVPDKPLRVKH
jgi:hypothetical protein